MRRKTDKEYRDELKEAVGQQYILISNYTNRRIKVLMYHRDCGKFYWVNPDSFINGGRRCPYCYGNKRKTKQQFEQEVYNKYGNEYKVLGDYHGANTPIKVLHTVCNHTFLPTPNSLLNGHGCRYCSYRIRGQNKSKTLFMGGRLSKGERVTQSVLDGLGIKYIYGYVLPNRLHLDFFIPTLKVGIEYDGIQHFEPRALFGGYHAYQYTKRHDHEKDIYCRDHGIRLIRISYTLSDYESIRQYLLYKMKGCVYYRDGC